MQLYLDRSPLQAVNMFYGRYRRPIQWEDEYDEENFPVNEYPFVITTLSGMGENQTILRIEWTEFIPPDQEKVEKEIKSLIT